MCGLAVVSNVWLFRRYSFNCDYYALWTIAAKPNRTRQPFAIVHRRLRKIDVRKVTTTIISLYIYSTFFFKFSSLSSRALISSFMCMVSNTCQPIATVWSHNYIPDKKLDRVFGLYLLQHAIIINACFWICQMFFFLRFHSLHGVSMCGKVSTVGTRFSPSPRIVTRVIYI